MIVANLATYPPRRESLANVVASLAGQVDRLNVVLNEYAASLPELEGFANVKQIIPPTDTKDVGKFYPDLAGADFVLLVDDDLIYPADFVAKTVERLEAIDGPAMGGYHGSTYFKPPFSLVPRRFKKWMRYRKARAADYRKVIQFWQDLEQPTVVDQIGTGTAILRAADMPPYSFMADSQKFVDVRLARWCFERGIAPVALPRKAGWLGGVEFEETIFQSFTKTNPPAVTREILSYAFRVKGRGKAPKLKGGQP